MPSTWVHLIRHGEVERAAERRFVGHADVPLSETGRRQAAALGRRLAAEAIEAVYASDLRRARDSAAPLAAARGVTAVTVPALREMAMGRWEALTFGEIQAREPDRVARWLADPVAVPFPGGESLEDLRARVVPALRAIVARHPGGRVAIVAHAGSNRVILAEALGLPLANVFRLGQDYAAASLIEFGGGSVVVHALNERPGGPALVPPAGAAPGG